MVGLLSPIMYGLSDKVYKISVGQKRFAASILGHIEIALPVDWWFLSQSACDGNIRNVKRQWLKQKGELHVIFGTGPVGMTLAEELLTDEA